MTVLLITIAVYMILMLAVGIFFAKKAKTPDDYYLSGRSLPLPVIIFTFAATWIGASATLGKAALAYSSGISAISPTIGSFIAFFIFSFFAGKIRKIGAEHNINSIPNLFNRRFGKLTSFIASAVIVWTLVGMTGTQLIAFAKILQFIFEPYGISYVQALCVSLAVVVIYTGISGMYGVAYTDVVQGVILLLIIGIIVPGNALRIAGGWTDLTANLDATYFSFKPDISMIGYMVTSFLYFVAGPPYWQRAFAAKSSGTAQRGALGGNLVIIFYTLSVILIGICAAYIYPGVSAYDSDMILLVMVEKCMSPVVYALTVAAVMAVIMSTTDSYLILSAQTLTTDLIGLFSKDVDPKKIITLSRVSVAVIGLLSLVFALTMKDIFQALMLSMTHFAAAIAVPAFAALTSRKVTKQAMTASMLSGLVSAFLWSGPMNKPWGLSEAIAGSVVSLVAIIVVSVLTQKSSEAAPYFE